MSVPRLLVILVTGLVVGAGGFFLFTLTRPVPVRAPIAARTEAPARPPAVRDAPAAPAPPRPAPRRAAEPTREAPPPPAPAPAADLATLRIDADVPGAQVFIDRNYLGTTPFTAENIQPGPHQLNVSAPGYEGVSEPIDVAAGSRDITIKLKEVRLKATIDVVHKHRLGSCKGQLLATPQGFRYETADKDDAFTAALLDIDTFEVDYLAKNLRVHVKRGKRYDFTDPEGNADRLFVFHRDVQKAMERIKKGDPPASH